MQFEFKKIEDSEVIVVKLDTYNDERGELSEIYNREQFYTGGIYDDFIHEVENKSKFNVIRGLHYQAKGNALSKLIRVVKGCYRCVFIDIRESSDNYGSMYSYVLDDLKEMVYVPVGYALGIQSFDHINHFIYKMSKSYDHEQARSINPIRGTQALVLSNGKSLKDYFNHDINRKLSELQNEFMASSYYRTNWDEPTKWLTSLVSEKDNNAATWGDYLKIPEF